MSEVSFEAKKLKVEGVYDVEPKEIYDIWDKGSQLKPVLMEKLRGIVEYRIMNGTSRSMMLLGSKFTEFEIDVEGSIIINWEMEFLISGMVEDKGRHKTTDDAIAETVWEALAGGQVTIIEVEVEG